MHWAVYVHPHKMYESPKVNVKIRFISQLAKEFEGVHTQKHNSKCPLIFPAVIIYENHWVTNACNIWWQIERWLDLWDDRDFSAFVVNCMVEALWNLGWVKATGIDAKAQRYNNLVIEGKLWQAVSGSCNGGGNLLPEDHCTKDTTKTIHEALKTKPEPLYSWTAHDSRSTLTVLLRSFLWLFGGLGCLWLLPNYMILWDQVVWMCWPFALVLFQLSSNNFQEETAGWVLGGLVGKLWSTQGHSLGSDGLAIGGTGQTSMHLAGRDWRTVVVTAGKVHPGWSEWEGEICMQQHTNLIRIQGMHRGFSSCCSKDCSHHRYSGQPSYLTSHHNKRSFKQPSDWTIFTSSISSSSREGRMRMDWNFLMSKLCRCKTNKRRRNIITIKAMQWLLKR